MITQNSQAKVKYPLVQGANCARFSYHGKQRVVRLIADEKGNILTKNGCFVGYETKSGEKQFNLRFAQVKSFKIAKLEDGKLTITKN